MKTKTHRRLDRITTREAAIVLGRPLGTILTLLRAAAVPCTRCGSSYLWAAEAVDRLAVALRKTTAEGGQP